MNLLIPFQNNYKEELIRRTTLISKIKTDKDIELFKRYYSTRPVEFINDLCFTYDPRIINGNKFIPFVLWDKQIEIVNFINNRYSNKESGIIEKSRDFGLTWITIAYAVWLWLLDDTSPSIGFGSRKAEMVDKLGNLDSILEKGRAIIRFLPKFMLPVGFNYDKHLSSNRFLNPETNATITGEGGDNIGRGGRKSIYFKDESAFYERAELIEASLSGNTNCQIDISTPNGVGNVFYQKCVSGNIPKLKLHWTDDPRKNDLWKENKIKEIGEVIFAQEYDLDYSASLPNICIPYKIIKPSVNYKLDDKNLIHGKIFAGLDVADDGADKNAIVVRNGGEIIHIEQWGGMDPFQSSLRAFEICKNLNVDYMYFDAIGVGTAMRDAFKYSKAKHKVKVFSVKVGESASKKKLGKDSADRQFINLKAELWWRVRLAFMDSSKAITENKLNEDIIILPNNNSLLEELSTPLYFYDNRGKMKIESKSDLRSRGVKSPNLADAFILCYSNLAIKDYNLIYGG